jgi:hypothetical protein
MRDGAEDVGLPVMQCCGTVDVDGKTVSAEQKLYKRYMEFSSRT